MKRLTLATYVNPLIERYDYNFLLYIKNEFKFLVQQDTKVSLLVDKIPLKPYIDHNGGNIVGIFDSYEAATSAFAFMFSSVFSHSKNVHVMPTKCQS